MIVTPTPAMPDADQFASASSSASTRQTYCYICTLEGQPLYADSLGHGMVGAVLAALRAMQTAYVDPHRHPPAPACTRLAGGSLEVYPLGEPCQGYLCLYHTATSEVEHGRILALQEKNTELASLVESSNDGIVMSDANGRYIYCNPSYLRISGLAWDDIIGRTAAEMIELGLVDSASAPEIFNTGKPVIATQTFHTGVRTTISGSPIFDANGAISRVIVNLRNTTELENLREELEISQDKLHKVSAVVNNLQAQQRSAIFTSPAMRKLHLAAHNYALVNAPLLITGETGVGKEVIADLVHRLSPRNTCPFLKLNCAAIPEQLLESELFGYEGGAFTGARTKGRIGLLEMADSGMVFLDEVNSLSLDLQAKLLRFMQEQEFYRVGGNRLIRVDVRLVAAANRDLELMMQEGLFRADFYYRMHVLQLHIPPLRERIEDINPLVHQFLSVFNEKYGLNASFSHASIKALIAYPWPGNVRELENIVERLVITCGSRAITPDMLPATIGGEPDPAAACTEAYQYERDLFERAFWKKMASRYRTTRQIASATGVSHATVVNKLHKYNLKIQHGRYL